MIRFVSIKINFLSQSKRMAAVQPVETVALNETVEETPAVPSTQPIYISLTQFLPMFHERFREAFPEYTYVGDLALFYEASQCFMNQFKQVNVKPLAIRVRIEPKLNDFSGPKDFKLIDHKQLLTICQGQPIIKFTETKRRTKPSKKNGIYVLFIESEQQSFENKEGETIWYYPSETAECNDRNSIKWIRDRVVSNNRPRRLDTSLHV